MPPAVTLEQAAGRAFDNLQILWVSNNMKTRLNLFWRAILPLFEEQDPKSHPVSNWCSVLAASAEVMPASSVPIGQLTNAAEIVYRLCWMTSYLRSVNQISSAQATAVLGNYNTFINI